VGGDESRPGAGAAHCYTRKTALRFAALWEQAGRAPLTRAQAAGLCRLTPEGVRKILLAMLDGGHLQALPRAHRAQPVRYVATRLAPPAPGTARASGDGKKHEEQAAELARTQARFADWPAWLVRVPRSLDTPPPNRCHRQFLED
jgi:hypothetical protein